MKPVDRFLGKPKSFWAAVRLLSQKVGYSQGEEIIIPSMEDMVEAYAGMGFELSKLQAQGEPTELAASLSDYFTERARVLMCEVEPKLMDAGEAKGLFEEMEEELKPTCPLPMNKQTGEKRAKAFLTGIVNMMVEKYSKGLPCDYDPRELTTVTREGAPLRTLARRVDGAFPSVVNPVAVWEIKEYYYTRTFGSRVAGGVYETLLDGMELEELRENEQIEVQHYLITDARYTWWECGKAYLCRMFDMLHMGYADEILFGREVVEEMPRIVTGWVDRYRDIDS